MANSVCSTLGADEMFDLIDCVSDNAKGFEAECVFVKRADIDFSSIEYDTEYPNVVTKLQMKKYTPAGGGGEKAYGGAFVYGLKNFASGTTTEFAEGNFQNTVTDTVAMTVWSSDAKSAENLKKMLNGCYVAILKQKYKDGQGVNSPIAGGAEYRIYGLAGDGLQCTSMSNDVYSDDGNIWNVQFQNTNNSEVMQFLCVKESGEFSINATEAVYQSLGVK